jgi:hypothetical protein
MAERSSGAIARMIGIAVLLVLAAASEAYAENFWWQARRSSNWSDGIGAGGVSNWYTLPAPNGVALNSPGIDDTAIFARGARSYNITAPPLVQFVRTMSFLANAPQYAFNVPTGTSVSLYGGGLYSRSAVPPRFYVQRGGYFVLHSSAALFSYTAARPALIFVNEGHLGFWGQSRGGNAWAQTSGGEIIFHQNGSAERMTLVNIAAQRPPYSRIAFFKNADGGSAHIMNQHAGIVDFTNTLGPAGNGRVNAGKIDNFGNLYIGTRTLILSDSFTQKLDGAYGQLYLNVFRNLTGSVRVAKRAILGGRITITGTEVVRGRYYMILAATGGVTGRFEDVFISGIPGDPYLIYGAQSVVMYVPAGG